jgi:hypothetical protein
MKEKRKMNSGLMYVDERDLRNIDAAARSGEEVNVSVIGDVDKRRGFWRYLGRNSISCLGISHIKGGQIFTIKGVSAI